MHSCGGLDAWHHPQACANGSGTSTAQRPTLTAKLQCAKQCNIKPSKQWTFRGNQLTAKLLHHKLQSDASFEAQLMHLSGPIEGLLVFSSELRKSNPTRKKTPERTRENKAFALLLWNIPSIAQVRNWNCLNSSGTCPHFLKKKWCRRAKCCGLGQATFRPPQNEPQLKPLKLGHVIIVASPAVAKSRSEENWRPAKNENTISNKCFLHNRIKCVHSTLYQ